jgi:uncharacterized protein involved in exopolysaccharide biosynthesis
MSMATPTNDLPGYDDAGSAFRRRMSPFAGARFVLGAARRRPWTFILVLLLGLGSTTAYYVLKTPVYYVEARILAQRQQALPSMIRTAGADEAPTRTASEFVHQRENLLALIREANLLPSAPSAPADGPRGVASRVLGGGEDEDPMNTLVVRLDRALKVTTGDGVITISIEWNDPQQAYHLVEMALQNFLEARQVQDITAFDEAISLMQGRVAVLRQQVDREEARETGTSSPAEPLPDGASSRAPSPRTQQPQTEELARLKSMVDAKERAVRDMEDARRRRLSELQAQLDERRGVYSDAHPNVIALRREIESFGTESKQLVSLREEEAQLRQEYAARLAAEPRPTLRAVNTYRPLPVMAGRASGGPESDRLREARGQYQNMLSRVNEAQLALDTARAAFKHRYTVIRPAEVPRSPYSPKAIKVFGLGGAMAFLLAVLAAALPDLTSGRILERWQLERTLDLPVLADFAARDER